MLIDTGSVRCSVFSVGVRCSVLGAQVRTPFPILSAAYALKLTGCFKFNAFETTSFFLQDHRIFFDYLDIYGEYCAHLYFHQTSNFCHILESSSESSCSWTMLFLFHCHFSFCQCSDVCWMYITYSRFHWHCFGRSRISYYIFRASPPFFVLQLSFFIFPTLRT